MRENAHASNKFFIGIYLFLQIRVTWKSSLGHHGIWHVFFREVLDLQVILCVFTISFHVIITYKISELGENTLVQEHLSKISHSESLSAEFMDMIGLFYEEDAQLYKRFSEMALTDKSGNVVTTQDFFDK